MNPALTLLMRAGASGGATYEYLSSQGSTTAGTSFTFAGLSLGAAAANRSIIVAVGSQAVPTGVTVGGVAATLHRSFSDPSQAAASIYTAEVPSGATGDVVVSFGGSVNRCGVALWATFGSLAYSVGGTSTTANASVTLTAPANALCIAVLDTNQQDLGLAGVTVRGLVILGVNPRMQFGDARPAAGSHTVTTSSVNYYNSLVVVDFTLT